MASRACLSHGRMQGNGAALTNEARTRWLDLYIVSRVGSFSSRATQKGTALASGAHGDITVFVGAKNTA